MSITFDQLYLANLCPIFVGSFENLDDSGEINQCIMVDQCSKLVFELNETLLQSYQDFISHLQ